jgi:hypothetical protein
MPANQPGRFGERVARIWDEIWAAAGALVAVAIVVILIAAAVAGVVAWSHRDPDPQMTKLVHEYNSCIRRFHDVHCDYWLDRIEERRLENAQRDQPLP